MIADWREKYNCVRPRRSLGMATPKELAAKALEPKDLPGGTRTRLFLRCGLTAFTPEEPFQTESNAYN